MYNIFPGSLKKTCHQRKLRQNKCFLFNCQVQNGFFGIIVNFITQKLESKHLVCLSFLWWRGNERKYFSHIPGPTPHSGTQEGKPDSHFSKPSKHFRKSGLFITLFVLLLASLFLLQRWYFRPLIFFPSIFLSKLLYQIIL